MAKVIYWLILLLVIPLASAVTLTNQTHYNPSRSNVTYILQLDLLGVTVAKVNQTCLTINTTSYCNQSATDININITTVTDTTAPIISNLRNTSTTNQSSFIEWDCDENCNYTINWYNWSFTSQVDSVVNSTFSLSHTPFLSNLTNSTTYLINLTVCDVIGNCRTDLTFNFTTASNMIITPVTISPAGGGGSTASGGCDYYSQLYKTCYYANKDMLCVEGCGEGYICGDNYTCTFEEKKTAETCSRDIPVWTRLASTCRDPLNAVCDDGEYPLVDTDCNLLVSKITTNEIFYEMWLLRLLILITIILYLMKSKDYLFFMFIDAVLLAFNDAFTITPLVELTPGAAIAECTIKNIGACLWPSNPKIGWAIFFVLLFVIVYLIGRAQVKRRIKNKKQRQQEIKTTTDKLQ